MKKSRCTDEQIIGLLKQAEAGVPVKQMGCKHGFSDVTFCRWRGRFGGMEVADARRLREIEEPGTRMLRSAARLASSRTQRKSTDSGVQAMMPA